jgi:DNA-binding NtrC family response regulator
MPTRTDDQLLVIEDDPEIRRAVREALEDEGYAVREAPDGAVGLRLLARTEESLVALVDYRMPQIDGYLLFRTVAEGGANLQRHAYVLVTANHAHLPSAFVRLLASCHIPIVDKPFDLDTLLLAVATARDHREQAHEQQASGV